ncbi:MAG: transcriptional regulator [Methanomicrobiales archaeon HGW-Methanomicrobiales-3]|jgi:DNA-binding transcriptional ArsR family regulator|nr:MAG: transcriptional regulator [Methanomicrobiales archaeon HGW-Methanomicrobiales-3]
MAETILVLEPGDERAQKIARAMSSQTANDILQQLAGGPTSLADIAERLGQPMNTVKYHVGNLLDAGLIAVADTKYSVKGREVKMYSLTNQLLIVAPRQSPVRSLILKYASLFAIVLVATIGIMALGPLFSGLHGMPGAAENVALAVPPSPTVADRQVAGGAEEIMTAKASYAGAIDMGSSTSPDTALAFFLGGILVILVLLCYEAWLWKRK